LVDFGGARNKDWLPQNIYFNADSLTVTVTDSSDEGKVLLSGTDGNLKTSTDNIKVIATAENNTGDAAADLAKIAGVVQLNVKDSDDTSIAQNVSTPHTGYTVTQEADDINDAASGIVTLADDGSATVTNITKVANVNVTGIAETSAIGLQIWRNEINDMNKRMGELRDSMGEANGVWARVYNGKARSGSLSITNKYTTFQFGYDHQVSHGVWLGGAVHYTDGDQDFAQGGGENSTYGFTAYGSWLADNGFFLDVTGKVGRIKNSFDITTSSVHSTGSYHTNAVSVSAEAGWRVYPFENPFFIEPQVELMYGHVFGEDYRTSTGMTVSQSSADTIIGRAGFALGIKCPGNRGNAYIRASVLHDWDGDADYAYTSASGVSRKLTEELGGTWYEYGIGANFNATKQLHIYADAERSSSGVMDTDYRINVGVRYAW
ncbi:autotransporter outer membrane beta-barrel domain-containing protein, partial [Sutterella sp.]|uniref:autotransporter outer membrane beta-barrel domain-containing protein n=1 Tax=Sutterella sp. TaxID=1981025 RepID=UPI0026E0EC53